MSNFRIRQFDTIILLPSDGDYKGFVKRAKSSFDELKTDFNLKFQKVDIEKAIQVGHIDISSIFRINEIMAIRYKIEPSAATAS